MAGYKEYLQELEEFPELLEETREETLTFDDGPI